MSRSSWRQRLRDGGDFSLRAASVAAGDKSDGTWDARGLVPAGGTDCPCGFRLGIIEEVDDGIDDVEEEEGVSWTDDHSKYLFISDGNLIGERRGKGHGGGSFGLGECPAKAGTSKRDDEEMDGGFGLRARHREGATGGQ